MQVEDHGPYTLLLIVYRQTCLWLAERNNEGMWLSILHDFIQRIKVSLATEQEFYL